MKNTRIKINTLEKLVSKVTHCNRVRDGDTNSITKPMTTSADGQQFCQDLRQKVFNLEIRRSRLREQLKTSRFEFFITEQIECINNEISQIKKTNSQYVLSLERPYLVTRRTSFSPVTNGFNFPNTFVNTNLYFAGIGPYETSGRCGGMAYASLDYYYSGKSTPKLSTLEFQGGIVPPDGHPLADYIYRRLLDSFRKSSSYKYITLSGTTDQDTKLAKGLTRRSKEDEFKKLRSQIDKGIPVVLGLIFARNIVDNDQNHQVVAYGYSYDNDGHIEIFIYDNNYPLKESILSSDATNPYFDQRVVGLGTNIKIWRGFFVHDYVPQMPPQLEQVGPNGPFYVNRNLVITPLTVKQGDRIQLQSSGSVDFGGAVFGAGPPKLNADGYSQKTPPDYPAPNLRKNSLIIKIGNNWYQGGTNKSFVTAVSGAIQLYINDSDPRNNTGTWKIYLNIVKPVLPA
jgi:hypothetical protein